MTCKQCNKDMNGKFFVLNVVAALMDKTKTWVLPPTDTTVDLTLQVARQNHGVEVFEGNEYETDIEVPREIDIFKKMSNYDNCSTLGDRQAEDYFCSKECLVNWFSDAIKELPNL